MSETNGVVKPNLASAWKKNSEAVLVEFPSGLQAQMTRPSVMSLMTSDKNEIPDTFFNLLIEAQQGGKNPTEGMGGSEFREFMQTLDMLAVQLAKIHFVNPRVVESNPDYENGEISVADVKAMDPFDKQYLTNWGMNGGDHVVLLQRFRQQQAKLMAAAQNGEGVS